MILGQDRDQLLRRADVAMRTLLRVALGALTIGALMKSVFCEAFIQAVLLPSQRSSYRVPSEWR
jgi:hypothetical protein